MRRRPPGARRWSMRRADRPHCALRASPQAPLVRPDGVTSFSMIQAASDSGNAAALVFFLFDLLYLDGEDLCARPLQERKARLAALLSNVSSPLHYTDHQIGHGRAFHEKACAISARIC
jgi:bifunctional non-homologous end joining protein LigD